MCVHLHGDMSADECSVTSDTGGPIQAEICAIKACLKENTEKAMKLGTLRVIKVPSNFHINPKLVWNCHHSLVKVTP